MAVPKPLRFVIKRHSTRPYLEVLVTNSDGTPFNFTGATSVRFSMKDEEDTVVIDNAVAGFSGGNPALGKLQYRWTASDTDTEGEYSAEFDVVYSPTEKLTLPLDGDIRVKIYVDVNDA